MFYPPSLLDLNTTPKPAPFYDTPIVRHQPLRALAARVARGAPPTANVAAGFVTAARRLTTRASIGMRGR